jgi:hypothetical protein
VCPLLPLPFAHETGSESHRGKRPWAKAEEAVLGRQLVSYSSYPAQVPRPDDPDCRELQAEGSSNVSDAVVLMVKVIPTTHGALLVPLQDDCYGNSMTQVLCFEMPSSTEEPTEVPNQQPVLPRRRRS